MEEHNVKTIPSFGYEIIRDHLLQSILGKHEEDVLYWQCCLGVYLRIFRLK